MARRFGAIPLRLAVGSVLALAGLALVAAPASATGPNTTTTVTASPGAVNGGPVTFTATVTHANAVPTGTVTFTVTGADSTPFTCDAGNVASLSTNPSGPGAVATCSFAGGLAASDSNYTVNAVYSGDGTFATSMGTLSAKIKRGGTSTQLVSSSNPTVTGQTVTFTATVGVTSPATGTPTGSYTFSISGTGGGNVACDTTGDTVPLSGNSADCTISAGLLAQYSPYAVTATYSGDSDFAPSTANLSQTVSKAAVTLGLVSSAPDVETGQPVSFTASITSVTPPGSGTPNGTITFSVVGSNGTVANCDGGNTQTLSGGSATCSFAKGLSSNPISYTVTATLKDANFKASSSASLVLQTQKATTTTTVSGLPGSLVASQGFTFTVTIQTNAPGTGVPTGDLEWSVCPHSASTCSGLPGGTYVLPTPTKSDIKNNEQKITYSVPGGMPPGFYDVNANFSGDSNYQNSATSPSTEGHILVSKVPTSLNLKLQRNPMVQGNDMVIRASVIANSRASGSLGAPQGTVTFQIEGAGGDFQTCDTGSNVVTISTNEANQGYAVCTVPAADITAADGPYEVQAQYSGDSNYDTVSASQQVNVEAP